MLLDATRHAEMPMGDQFHLRQHRQHSGDSKNAGQNAARSGHHGNGDRKPDAVFTQCRARGSGKRVIPRLDDFGEGKIAGNGKAHKGVNHDARSDGNNDRQPNIPVRVFHLGAAVGNGRETFEGQYSQCRCS